MQHKKTLAGVTPTFPTHNSDSFKAAPNSSTVFEIVPTVHKDSNSYRKCRSTTKEVEKWTMYTKNCSNLNIYFYDLFFNFEFKIDISFFKNINTHCTENSSCKLRVSVTIF